MKAEWVDPEYERSHEEIRLATEFSVPLINTILDLAIAS